MTAASAGEQQAAHFAGGATPAVPAATNNPFTGRAQASTRHWFVKTNVEQSTTTTQSVVGQSGASSAFVGDNTLRPPQEPSQRVRFDLNTSAVPFNPFDRGDISKYQHYGRMAAEPCGNMPNHMLPVYPRPLQQQTSAQSQPSPQSASVRPIKQTERSQPTLARERNAPTPARSSTSAETPSVSVMQAPVPSPVAHA